MATYREANVSELADFLRIQKSLGVSTCFLIGAGASVSAGIPDARGIMDDLKERFPKLVEKATSESYFAYMSLLPEGIRRKLIRTYIDNCRLNKSYLSLAALVKNGYVDRLLTTNFDPLLERAISLSGCNASVYDFASSRRFISGDAGPLSLLYLHGRADGFLLLNTESEISSLANKLRVVFEDSNRNRAWVIVGYSGNDAPVFKELSRLDSYQYGLYWVGHRNQDPNLRVRDAILNREDTYWVKGETSDTFFEKLLANLKIKLDEQSRPKVRVDLSDIDTDLNKAAIVEAADLFGVAKDQIECIAYKIYHENTGISYLHRVVIRRSDYELIEEKFSKDSNPNIIRSILERKKLSLCLNKSHQFLATVVGKDAGVIGQSAVSPAMLHIQVSYAEPSGAHSGKSSAKLARKAAPIELLLTKYTTPLNLSGFLLDREPKSGHAYSKAAEDLYQKKSYQQEVIESISEFYLPFSHVNIALTKNEKKFSSSLPHSVKPARLLRIVIIPEYACNYNCSFCCQPPVKLPDRSCITPRLQDWRPIIDALSKSGYRRMMLTGGEPLLCPHPELLNAVKTISSIQEIDEFWICTNGSLLNKSICRQLRDNGLNKLVVTVAAETNEKYQACTQQNKYNLDSIIGKLQIALQEGLRVKVDIPLNRSGIKNVKEFMRLIGLLRKIGIKEAAYFQLHKTNMNAMVFDQLFVNQDIITWELSNDNSLKVMERENGQKVFSDGSIEIVMPALLRHETENCRTSRCGPYCQGVYAAYLIPGKDKIVLRACHRELPKNTFTLSQAQLKAPGRKKLSDVIRKLRTWAYESPDPV